MEQKIAELLNQVFNGNKVNAMVYIQTQGYDTWKQLKHSSDENKQELINKLKEMKNKDYIKVVSGDYTIIRPKNPRHVSEISFSIKGLKL
jgi:hypothetical protein